MQATYAQRLFDARIEVLNQLNAIEKRVQNKVTKAPGGGYQVIPEPDLKPEQRSLLTKALAARIILEEGARRQAAPLLTTTADGYLPSVGFSMGWALWQLSLSNEQTENLIDIADGAAELDGIGAGIAALLGPEAVPFAIIGGISAALFVVGATHLKVTNNNGGKHGVYWQGANAEILGGVPALAIHSQIFFPRYPQ